MNKFNRYFVSVIMPAYNSREYIAEAIHSVLDQDYRDLELIIVDDGSTDGTAEEALKFGDRVKVLVQKNAGPAAARNRGVKAANGQFLAFIDSDDVWMPGKISAQVSYLKNNSDVGVVFGRLVRWYPNELGAFLPPPFPTTISSDNIIVHEESGWIYPEMLLDSVIWIVSALIRKEIWIALEGLDESLRTGEDYDFFIRSSRICKMDELNLYVAYYRIHPACTTHVIRTENNECLVLMRALKRYGIAAPDGRKVSSNLLHKRLYKLNFDHAYRHFWYGDSKIAIRYFTFALEHAQWKALKCLTYLFLAYLKKAIPRQMR